LVVLTGQQQRSCLCSSSRRKPEALYNSEAGHPVTLPLLLLVIPANAGIHFDLLLLRQAKIEASA
jgi:hypothetical protein